MEKMTFAESLRNYLESSEARQHRGAPLRRVLVMHDGAVRRRLLDTLERHAVAATNLPMDEPTDWASFDWVTWGEIVLKILLAILPLLLL